MTGHSTAAEVVEPISFDQFYGPTRDSVARALTATLGSSEVAVDATDEALARAYQRWDRVSQLDSPAGWVYRVGLNYARNRIRTMLRRQRRRVVDRDAQFAPAADAAIADPAIAAALMRLSVDQRAVVACRYLLGWSERDTAEALAIRPGTVKSRLSRALAALERHLAHYRTEES